MPVLEKLSVSWLIANCPPSLLAGVFMAFLVSWVALRINRVISNATNQELEQTDRIAALEKQQGKLIMTICSCEKVTKKTAMWLQNKKLNGGDIPEELKK